MPSIKTLQKDLTSLGYIRGVLETFEEMAASKMQKVRGKIEEGRAFANGLSELSYDIGMDVMNVTGIETVIPAYLLFGPNAGMFGGYTALLVEQFLREIEGKSGDIYVVGEMAGRMLGQVLGERNFRILRLPNDEMDDNLLQMTVAQMRNYRRVRVVYGKFVNLAKQEVAVRDLAGEMTLDFLAQKDKEIKMRRLKYLYEPSLDIVGSKLSKEVFVSVMGASAEESQLAKFAARLMQLDQSLYNLDKLWSNLHRERRRVSKKIENKKQSIRVVARRKHI